MTDFPIVLLVWFAWFRWRNRQSWRPRFSWVVLVPKQRQLDAFGKIPTETANDGHFALLDHDLAKTSDNPATAGEKFPAEIANHGDQALIRPRSCQNQRQPIAYWEKLQGKPPIMAITLFLIAIVLKPATTAMGWEKFLGKPPIMAIPKKPETAEVLSECANLRSII